MSENQPRRILIAPLDWGLGHTTRCMPIIRWLQQKGHSIIVACNDFQRSFIEKNFSGIEIIHLEGYNIKYATGPFSARTAVLGQLPKIFGAIKQEQKWLRQQLKVIQPDGIISDNRYGIYHPSVPSVIITHQLMIQTGMGALADRGLQNMHYKFLAPFNEVWVPDVAGEPNLGGKLSHPAALPQYTQYLGLLSQFSSYLPIEKTGDYVLILLSGPEPARGLLAEKLWAQATQYPGKVVFVGGSRHSPAPGLVPDHITYHSTLSGEALAMAVSGAAIVICRSGYSTLMDLVWFGKKAITIPTPGQTEQEYLAEHLEKGAIYPTCKQTAFHLEQQLERAKSFPFRPLALQNHFSDFEGVLERWVMGLKN